MAHEITLQNQARPAEIAKRVIEDGEDVPQKGTLIDVPRENPEVDTWQVTDVREVATVESDDGFNATFDVDEDEPEDDGSVRVPAGLLSPGVDSQTAYANLAAPEDVEKVQDGIDPTFTLDTPEDDTVDEDEIEPTGPVTLTGTEGEPSTLQSAADAEGEQVQWSGTLENPSAATDSPTTTPEV